MPIITLRRDSPEFPENWLLDPSSPQLRLLSSEGSLVIVNAISALSSCKHIREAVKATGVSLQNIHEVVIQFPDVEHRLLSAVATLFETGKGYALFYLNFLTIYSFSILSRCTK